MSENYFKFKQFTILQDKCAMKVGTDGVLLGAYADTANCSCILDIGTGTGLIALMLAQKSNANIAAVEIDKAAFEQAAYNVQNSIFSSRIDIINSSIQDYKNKTINKYDLIVSNPPFYQHHLKSGNKQKDIARHNISLSYNDLIEASVSMLQKNGKLCVIIPKSDEAYFVKICEKESLNLSKRLNIRPTPKKEIKRVILEFCFTKTNTKTQELIIEINGRHNYSEDYKILTKDFYLKF